MDWQTRGSLWAQPRAALRRGEVVFFPRVTVNKAHSIVSYERKRGMKFKAMAATYEECPGVVVWRTE